MRQKMLALLTTSSITTAIRTESGEGIETSKPRTALAPSAVSDSWSQSGKSRSKGATAADLADKTPRRLKNKTQSRIPRGARSGFERNPCLGPGDARHRTEKGVTSPTEMQRQEDQQSQRGGPSSVRTGSAGKRMPEVDE